MSEEANDWIKVGDLYTIDAIILQTGHFTDENGDELTIGEDDVKEILSNIKNPIPMAIGYNGHKGSKTIGQASQFANYDGYTKVRSKGHVFDEGMFKDAVAQGYTHISPEINVVCDEHDNVIRRELKKICFVKDHAMPDTTTSIKRFAFSAPEVTRIMPENTTGQSLMQGWTNTNDGNLSPNQPAPGAGLNVPQTNNSVLPPVQYGNINGFDPAALANLLKSAVSEEISSLRSEIEAMKSGEKQKTAAELAELAASTAQEEMKKKLETEGMSKDVIDEYARSQAENAKAQQELAMYREKEERSKKAEKAALVSELKTYKVENPENIGKGLSIDQQIEVLKSIKSSHAAYVATLPMTSTRQSEPMSAEGGNNQQQEITVTSLLEDIHAVNAVPMEKRKLLAERINAKKGLNLKV